MSQTAHFAIYFVPDTGALYEAGSRLSGYDIRRQQAVLPYDFLDPSWSNLASAYGFHISITDAIDIDEDKLPQIKRLVPDLLRCFKLSNTYTLRSQGLEYWNDTLLVASFIPSPHLRLLHDVLVARLHPQGSGSEYVTAYEQGELAFAAGSPEAAKIREFYSPYIFEDFKPHFTCLHPLTNSTQDQRDDLKRQIGTQLVLPAELKITKLALVIKRSGQTHYRIEAEYSLPQ